MSYRDETGEYNGDLYCNFPEGQGSKLYYDSSFYTGTWKMGRKEGHGSLETNNYSIELEYKEGIPHRLLKIHHPLYVAETSKKFAFSTTFRQKGNFWEEIFVPDKNIDENTYTAYLVKDV